MIRRMIPSPESVAKMPLEIRIAFVAVKAAMRADDRNPGAGKEALITAHLSHNAAELLQKTTDPQEITIYKFACREHAAEARRIALRIARAHKRGVEEERLQAQDEEDWDAREVADA